MKMAAVQSYQKANVQFLKLWKAVTLVIAGVLIWFFSVIRCEGNWFMSEISRL